MNELVNFFPFIILLLLIIVISWLIVLTLYIKGLFRGSNAPTLDGVLFSLKKSAEELEKRTDQLGIRITALEQKLPSAIQKVSMVRFNPFASSGGDQSFCIALLNDTKTGLVISGIHSREGMRVYAKPVERGASLYKLSKEEEEALNKAGSHA